MLTVNKNFNLTGYLEYSLSYMNITELNLDEIPANPQNLTYCRFVLKFITLIFFFSYDEVSCFFIDRYKDFRNPPWSPNGYDFSLKFWHVLVGRLLFMVIFQVFAVFLFIFFAIISFCFEGLFLSFVEFRRFDGDCDPLVYT